MRNLLAVIIAIAMCSGSALYARDVFLTIGGGYSPGSNQASIESNVLYSQRVLSSRAADTVNHVYFADGAGTGKDVEVLDRNAVPKANRLMAEFFGSTSNLGLSYRNHRVANVRGATKPESIRRWFGKVGSTMDEGDRLFVYVTAHGGGSRDRNNSHETTIAMWNNSSLRMTEFVKLLDGLPVGVDVVCVMVQCHAGGFARLIFNDGDPDAGLSPQKRVGFFATVHDRQAAGCTPEVDQKSYVEYSTYFWAALSGKDRLGNDIELPDYDNDGQVSLEEAHAYVILTANTIDLPLKSSGEFLTKWGQYGRGESDLLHDDAAYSAILAAATPVQKAVLEGLSMQLGLDGDKRVMDAYQQSRNAANSRRSRSRRGTSPQQAQLKTKIVSTVKRRWPELSNLMNPGSVELITTRQEEFIQAIEKHPSYTEYRTLAETKINSEEKRKVKFERFLRTVDNVIFAENLRREKKTELVSQYEAIVAAERGTLSL